MLWGPKLSSQTRLTSFPEISTMVYSLEIQDNNIALYLNMGGSKYSYWEYRPSSRQNVTFVQLSMYGLEIFNGNHKFDQIKPTGGAEAIRFMAVDNSTGNLRMYHYTDGGDRSLQAKKLWTSTSLVKRVKMEPMDIVGRTKEDASLPKEFINLVSSESNEVCNREEKRTITPEHVLKALEVLGFGEYIEDVYAAYEQHRLETMVIQLMMRMKLMKKREG